MENDPRLLTSIITRLWLYPVDWKKIASDRREVIAERIYQLMPYGEAADWHGRSTPCPRRLPFAATLATTSLPLPTRSRVAWRSQSGVPKMLCCDNASEFSSQATDLWAYQNGAECESRFPD
jgi:hypothetical protein